MFACGEIVDPVILEGQQLMEVDYSQNKPMGRCTMKRFGIVLSVFIFALSLGGCSCIQKTVPEETPPPAVVKPAPQPPPPPAAVKPAPPVKKDRN